MCLWDQRTGRATMTLGGHDSHVTDLQFWKYALSSSSADGTVRMWDSASRPLALPARRCDGH